MASRLRPPLFSSLQLLPVLRLNPGKNSCFLKGADWSLTTQMESFKVALQQFRLEMAAIQLQCEVNKPCQFFLIASHHSSDFTQW